MKPQRVRLSLAALVVGYLAASLAGVAPDDCPDGPPAEPRASGVLRRDARPHQLVVRRLSSSATTSPGRPTPTNTPRARRSSIRWATTSRSRRRSTGWASPTTPSTSARSRLANEPGSRAEQAADRTEADGPRRGRHPAHLSVARHGDDRGQADQGAGRPRGRGHGVEGEQRRSPTRPTSPASSRRSAPTSGPRRRTTATCTATSSSGIAPRCRRCRSARSIRRIPRTSGTGWTRSARRATSCSRSRTTPTCPTATCIPIDVDSKGRPIDAAWAASRDRNERLIEIKQIKGQSETHPVLSPNDEFANYEILTYLLGNPDGRIRPHSSAASCARRSRTASTMQDTQAATTRTRSASSAAPTRTTPACPTARTTSSAVTRASTATIKERMSGHLFAGLDVRLENPAGLTGVWAEENTRASLFDGMQRKETFGTSGPHITAALLRRLGVSTGDLVEPARTG